MTPYTEQISAACASSYSVEQFNAWLEAHDREVKAQAWQEGAAAAWFESGVLQYGDDYPRDNPSWVPFSIRKTNPYTEES